jgi:hypothetical protein
MSEHARDVLPRASAVVDRRSPFWCAAKVRRARSLRHQNVTPQRLRRRHFFGTLDALSVAQGGSAVCSCLSRKPLRGGPRRVYDDTPDGFSDAIRSRLDPATARLWIERPNGVLIASIQIIGPNGQTQLEATKASPRVSFAGLI